MDLWHNVRLAARLLVRDRGFTAAAVVALALGIAATNTGFALVNGRVGIGSHDERWTVELWGQNLTDEDYLQVAFNGPFQVDEANDDVSVYNTFLGAPRTFGVTLRTRF